MQSAKYSLNVEDLKKVGQAMVYSALSAALAGVMVVLANPDMLDWKTGVAAVLVPAVNGALVALKKWLDGKDFSKQND